MGYYAQSKIWILRSCTAVVNPVVDIVISAIRNNAVMGQFEGHQFEFHGQPSRSLFVIVDAKENWIKKL